MEATITEQLAGLTPRQQRRRLKAMAGSRKPKPRPVQRQWRPVIDWHAVIALQKPCACDKCQQARERWPAYYIVRTLSYECLLEANAPTDKRRWNGEIHTSSSPMAHALEHARITGARLDKGLPMEPESEAALKLEIAKHSKRRA